MAVSPKFFERVQPSHALAILILCLAPATIASPSKHRSATVYKPVAPKTFSISPNKGFVGKNYEVVVTSPGCVDTSNELSTAELYAPLGSGVSVENKKKSACSLTASITIAADAAADKIQLWIRKTGDETILGTADFTISNTLPPGPIPSGLTPQVDIMWSVIPEKIVGHNFGRTIERNYYCVELVIGNNTGYSLQIVSVGFAVPLTDAEFLKEALAKTGSKGDGQGKEPENGEGDENDNKDTLEKLTGNTRFLRIPNSSYRLTRGSLESRHLLYPRTMVLSTITALGPIFTGFTPYFHNINHRTNFSEAINIFSNPLEKGLELVWPDPRDAQRNRFDDQVLRDGLILANNVSTRSMVFFPKTLLKPYLDMEAVEFICTHRNSTNVVQCKSNLVEEFDQTYAAWKNNPRAVMDKLGKLILVGDVITATNRITVTSGPVPGPLAAPPTLLDVQLNKSPLREVTQGGGGSLEIIGSNLTGAHVTSNYDEIKVDPVTSDSTGKLALSKMKVSENAIPGQYTLIVSTGAGAIPVPITVIHKEGPKGLKLEYKNGDAFSETAPALKAHEDQPVEIRITGRNIKGATVTAAKPTAGGLNVNITDDSSDAELKATVVVRPETPAGKYNLTVRNSSGGTEVVKFEVKLQ
jgi:hypothetical protein